MTQRRIHQDAYPYFVTFNTRDGESWFEKGEYAKALAQTMRNAARLKGRTILAYQIMPNHVHLLVQQNHPRNNVTAGAETRGGVDIKMHRARLSAAALVSPPTNPRLPTVVRRGEGVARPRGEEKH